MTLKGTRSIEVGKCEMKQFKKKDTNIIHALCVQNAPNLERTNAMDTYVLFEKDFIEYRKRTKMY
jgi:hypothetical protein